MLSFFYKYLYILLFITILICIFFIPFFEIDNSSFSQYTNNNFVFSSYNFVWSIPGYTNISSPFGKRSSPTSGASTYHSGIDIPAPEGTKL